MGLCQKVQARVCPHHLALDTFGGGLLLIWRRGLPSCADLPSGPALLCYLVLESEAPASNDFIFV